MYIAGRVEEDEGRYICRADEKIYSKKQTVRGTLGEGSEMREESVCSNLQGRSSGSCGSPRLGTLPSASPFILSRFFIPY